eukprot:s596_g11.t1
MEPEGQIKLGLLSPSRKRSRVSSKEASSMAKPGKFSWNCCASSAVRCGVAAKKALYSTLPSADWPCEQQWLEMLWAGQQACTCCAIPGQHQDGWRL